MAHVYAVEGGRPLTGEVVVGGAKNSALKLLAATLLARGRSRLTRVPRIGDVTIMFAVLEQLGASVAWTGPDTVEVVVPEALGVEASYEHVSRMRASTAVLGALLAREGRARVAHPGGCNLGPRPIDLHIRGLEALGARIEVVGGYLEAEAVALRGAPVHLEYASIGATENVLMAASVARGRTVISNAAREPEITDLADFLNAMGARIEGAGTSQITVDGVDELRPATYHVMPDRIEAGTYMYAAANAGGDVRIAGMVPEHLTIVIEKLRDAGVTVETGETWVRVVSEGRPRAVDISTLPYPGFPTDLQPFAVVLAARADGLSIITENLYARFMFIGELVRMGANVRIEGHYAVAQGVPRLSGVPVKAPDLRAGAALVLAGLAADGTTTVTGSEHIDRGYEDMPGRLTALGASVERVPELVRT